MLRKLLPQKWTKIFLIAGLLNKKFHFFKKYEKLQDFLSKMVYVIGMNHQNSKNSFNPIPRKHLNADALFSGLRNDFSKISDFRQGNIEISMADSSDVRLCHVFP